ncbi:MAG: carbohydrate kinase family protein [Candidatus Thermoplasmatota archaeon]|nr:carbohydrate kinase family protein [Candidatus Thermoplasmatota archaeon]
MGKLLVCGNLNIDRILEIEYLPHDGQSAPVHSQRIVFGGCGGNISSAAAKLGIPVVLSSVVGADLDPRYRELLERTGVDLSGLVVDPELPSPCCTVLSAPDGHQAYAFMMGAMNKQSGIDIPPSDGVQYLHIATSSPEFCLKVSGHFGKKGIPVGFDPGQEIYFRWKGPEVKKVLGNSNRFFGNLGEWEYLMDILDIEWQEKSVGHVVYPFSRPVFGMIDEAVVTLGRRGSMLINKDGAVLCEPVEFGHHIDPTGAGDAFRGAFYAALMKGYSSVEAMKFGNAMGAVSITSAGPQDYEMDWDGLQELAEKG